MRLHRLLPVFVNNIPERLEEGRLYISRHHALAVHLCCCGCRGEVVTPLSAAEWQMTLYRGKVTLHPSVGNWGFPCQSHYWVRANQVDWALPMSEVEIALVRERDRVDLGVQVALANAGRSVQRPWWGAAMWASVARVWKRFFT